MRRGRRAVVLGLTLLPVAAPAAQAGVATPASCRERIAIECARVTVPLDRAGRVAGSVRLYVERLGDDRRKARALLFLAGGPGQAATPLVPAVAPALANVLDDRDVLILDQRGTGRSGSLRCAGGRHASERAQIEACARRLGPARDHYATADSVADIEDVRAALGIDQLTLYGTSYGTKVALEYAVAHPDHVDGLVLDSVVPEGPVEPLQRSSWAALPRILGTLCGEGRCAGITRDPVGDLAAVERLLARPRPKVRRITGRGRVVGDRIDPGSVVGLAFAGDFAPEVRAALPAALHAARGRDLAPLTRLLERMYGFYGGSVVSDPLYIATTCADDAFPWRPGASRAQRRSAADADVAGLARRLPFGVPRATLFTVASFDPCVDWPAAPRPAPVGPLPDVPALVVAGSDDLRTPVEDARAVARRLPRSHLLVVRGVGHSVIGDTVKDCPGRALLAFLRRRPVRSCAVRPVPAPGPLPPRRLADAARWPGLDLRTGRIVRATLATLADVRRDLDLVGIGRAGGLRAGWYRAGFLTVGLHGVESVSGLRVSGRLDRRGTARLRVRAGAVRGTLRIRGRVVSGRLDGTRVRAVLVP